MKHPDWIASRLNDSIVTLKSELFNSLNFIPYLIFWMCPKVWSVYSIELIYTSLHYCVSKYVLRCRSHLFVSQYYNWKSCVDAEKAVKFIFSQREPCSVRRVHHVQQNVCSLQEIAPVRSQVLATSNCQKKHALSHGWSFYHCLTDLFFFKVQSTIIVFMKQAF